MEKIIFRYLLRRFTAITLLLTAFVFISDALNAQVPTIISFSPSNGAIGTLITITGTNLGSPTAFTIGGTTAIVVSNTGTQLVGLVMPGTVTGTVSVTTVGGAATGIGNFTVIPTSFPNIQQGSKLVGIGAVNSPYGVWQGYAVSISSDGNTAIVGGTYDNSDIGAAWVYTRSGGAWTQQGNKLVGSGGMAGPLQGVSVSISSDGNTAIVGGHNDGSGVGAAWVYTRSGGIWTQQGSKLVGTGAIGPSDQGFSVSISADGNTAIVGGYLDNGNAGAAWVYTRSGGIWTQQGSKLVGTGAIGVAQQGWAVSISADGNTAIVGGDGDNGNAGAAWVYTRSGGVWTQQGSKLVGSGAIGGAQQGWAVSISADGNTAIVGGQLDNSDVGAAWVYTRSGGVWTQQGNKLVGLGALGVSEQGVSVSISSDGNTAIVGGPGDNNGAGAAWVYTRSGGVWTQQGIKLVGTGAVNAPAYGAEQGFSVSLSSDGNTAIVGGPLDNSYAGAAWVFVSSCTNPTTPTLGASSSINCGAQNTTLNIVTGTLNSATAWQWYSGSCGGTSLGSGTTITDSPASTTTYYARGEGGCVTMGSCDSITVTVNPLPVGETCCDSTIIPSQNVFFTVNPVNISDTYNWTPTEGLSCNSCASPLASPVATTTYYLTITNNEGCQITDRVTITINCGEIFVPDAFSPNGDGINDILYLGVPESCIKDMVFRIYDRWGNNVFKSYDSTNGWDGKYKGKELDNGVFVYELTATDSKNNIIAKKGNISLIK